MQLRVSLKHPGEVVSRQAGAPIEVCEYTLLFGKYDPVRGPKRSHEPGLLVADVGETALA
jgi:hypothetical protein